MTPFPQNPFEPGAGTTPAHMGRRPDTEDTLSGILGRLRAGRRNGYLAFVYGPRGNGKTALLSRFEEMAAAADVATVVPVPEHRESPESLIEAVRAATQRSSRLAERLSTVQADIGGVRVGSGGGRDSLPLLANLLNRGGDGILLTLDEAHEAPPAPLGRLLDAVQTAGRKRPVAAAFAGPPGLEAALRAAHASFWIRGRKLRIGLLAETSARAALARPFRDAELEADDGAVAELAAAADNYPYFLQLYGEAAWNVVEASGGRALLPEHVAPAIVAAEDERQDCCRDRLTEFSDADRLPLGRRVADAFVASAETPADRRLSETAPAGILARHGGVREAEAFLTAKGQVWQERPSEPFRTPGSRASWTSCPPASPPTEGTAGGREGAAPGPLPVRAPPGTQDDFSNIAWILSTVSGGVFR